MQNVNWQQRRMKEPEFMGGGILMRACRARCISIVKAGFVFGLLRVASLEATERPQDFGLQWVQSHPFTIHGMVLRDLSLNDTKLRNANFSSVLAWENNPQLLTKTHTVQGLPWHWHTGQRDLNAVQADLANYIENYPGGEGILVWDEPDRTEFPKVAEVVQWVKQNHPNMLVYGNLFPIRDPGDNNGKLYGTAWLNSNQYANPPVPYSYDDYLNDFINTVHPDVLMFDIYPYKKPPEGIATEFIRDSYFRNLESVRRVALNAQLPYWTFIQSWELANGGGARSYPSESDLRMQVFSSLAYGFTGLSYFTFDHVFDRGLLEGEFTQTPTPLYYKAIQVNREVSHFGKTLKLLTSTQVRYLRGKHIDLSTHQPASNALPLGVTPWNARTDDPYITTIHATNSGTLTNITEGDLLISHFKPALEELDGEGFEGEIYFMIVNLLRETGVSATDATQLVHLEFDFQDNGINSLQRLNRLTGEIEIVSLISDGGSRYHLDFTLLGGTGELFKYNTGAPFVVPEPGAFGMILPATTIFALRRNFIRCGEHKL